MACSCRCGCEDSSLCLRKRCQCCYFACSTPEQPSPADARTLSRIKKIYLDSKLKWHERSQMIMEECVMSWQKQLSLEEQKKRQEIEPSAIEH